MVYKVLISIIKRERKLWELGGHGEEIRRDVLTSVDCSQGGLQKKSGLSTLLKCYWKYPRLLCHHYVEWKDTDLSCFEIIFDCEECFFSQ